MLLLNAKKKKKKGTSSNFAEGHLKVEGVRESHLTPVPRQPYTRLISPQQKTNLAPADQFDLHASD